MNPGIKPLVKYLLKVERRFLSFIGKHVDLPGIRRRFPHQLVEAEGEEVHDSGSARESLAYLFHKGELLGTGKNESSGRIIRIHDPLEVREKRWRPLNFVEDDSAGEPFEKSLWIFQGKLPLIRLLKADIFVFLKHHPGQRRFPGLPRTRNGYNGELLGQGGQFLSQRSRKHIKYSRRNPYLCQIESLIFNQPNLIFANCSAI